MRPQEIEARAHGAFDGILEVRMQGWSPSFELWDDIVYWRGAQAVLFDLAARPEYMHAIASRYTDARLAMLDQLEARGLLGREQQLVHCTGAWTDELPAPGYEVERPRAIDSWTHGMAQVRSRRPRPCSRSSRSLCIALVRALRPGLLRLLRAAARQDPSRAAPAQRAQDLDEPVGRCGGRRRGDRTRLRIQLEAEIPTSSPWTVGYSTAIERQIDHVVDVCAEAGCPLEITMKDISTVRHRPQRLWEWAGIAMRVVQRERPGER